MKKTLIALTVGACSFIAACNDASTNDIEKKDTVTEKSKETDVKTTEEKTEISVGPNGASVSTKSGTEVKVGQEGATVGTKDVNIKLDKDTTDN